MNKETKELLVKGKYTIDSKNMDVRYYNKYDKNKYEVVNKEMVRIYDPTDRFVGLADDEVAADKLIKRLRYKFSKITT